MQHFYCRNVKGVPFPMAGISYTKWLPHSLLVTFTVKSGTQKGKGLDQVVEPTRIKLS